MQWCAECVLPDTRPNLTIDRDGVCNACKLHRQKPAIDWGERRQAFRGLIDDIKAQNNSTYDCVVPVSGGKDSTWQVLTCLEAGLRVLAVTWRTPGRTTLGQQNLDNLRGLGVDHVDFSISDEVERKFTLSTLIHSGSPAVPMHLALFNLPIMFAVKFQIPLVVWGENSAAEYGSADSNDVVRELDSHWLSRYGVSGGTTAEDWVSDKLTSRDLVPYLPAKPEEIRKSGVRSIFLGHYFPWDPMQTSKVASANGFKPAEAARTGLYNFADIDDDFISVHHWFKWYKFGFTRLFDNLSVEIRNKRISRSEALAVISTTGAETPSADISSLCAWLGLPETEFWKIAEKFRNPLVWEHGSDGTWRIPNFLIADWEWL